ncbi:hypothetical protein AB0D74_48445 [Streptomyces sp. NPDC048278]|uniref:hypothetical protein n=1 Tax=Streptomyces sp. NPDC048278 TaxID=3155809 RepID=UPI003426A033
MTDAPAPRFPTPADLAAGRIPARPAPAAPRFDRHAWEEALLAVVDLHYKARLLGWSLAHLAPASGTFRAGTEVDAGHLGKATRMSSLELRMGVKALERAGLLRREPGPVSGPGHVLARAFTLTLPPVTVRTEPAHTGPTS